MLIRCICGAEWGGEGPVTDFGGQSLEVPVEATLGARVQRLHSQRLLVLHALPHSDHAFCTSYVSNPSVNHTILGGQD